jgi:hypothetical protein
VHRLKQFQPTTFGYLVNAANPVNQFRRLVDDWARALDVKLEIVEVKALSELAEAISRMASLGAVCANERNRSRGSLRQSTHETIGTFGDAES